MLKLRNILAMGMVACMCMLTPASADDDDKSLKEYQVKAAFLYNFVKFVEWPGAQAFAQTHAANICIIGDDPFGSTLDVFAQASTPQLQLNVKRGISEGGIYSCHILFISRSEESRAASLLATARAAHVLTVSEIKGFADDGGIVEMAKTREDIGLFSKHKINLRVNLKVANGEGLRIDAQLLEIAAEVIK